MRTPHFDPTVSVTARRSPDSEWIARQVEALTAAWERGERLTAEDVLAQHSPLDPEASIRLVYEEVCLRRESGQEVRTSEVVRRFPQWQGELEVLFDCDRALRSAGDPVVFPEVGETLGTFRLLAELGRGASGRTYLASEPALADRLVAVKVIPDEDEEHLSLARLQHTHIVPLFSEQAFPALGLRSLCMPYLGGTSLDRVLEALADVSPEQRLGRDFLNVIDQARGFSPTRSPAPDGPYRRYLEKATCTQAACWMVACLADALQYAHARGLIHMDVKPSNVLIAGDGQPMLLDFHLARGPISAGAWVVDRLGGTPGWMSPEQSATIDAVRLGRRAPASVDFRSDLYALGALLCKLLGGPGAVESATAGRPWRRRNPEVSAGLAAIVEKCLAPRPSDRYPDAASLADDLRRHLNDLPLRGVPNRSPVERWHRWRRRGALARGVAWVSALGAAVLAAALAGAFYSHRVGELEAALDEGRRLCQEAHYADAVRTLRRGLTRSGGLPAVSHLTRPMAAQLLKARRGQKAAELNRLADLIRFRYGLAAPSGAEARVLLRDGQAIWDERNFLLAPGSGALDPETERQVRTNFLELAVVWTDLRVRLAPAEEAAAARRDALTVLDETERALGPSPSVRRERRQLGGAVSTAESDERPQSAWEHYDLGRSYLRSGRIEEADEEFRRTLERRPQDFWPNFYQGLCAHRLGRPHEALAAFRTCIALAPESAECYHNRALSADVLGMTGAAFHDYSRALELDPALTAAALNRGILSYHSHRYDDALADFRRALRNASAAETVGRIHYNMALVHLARDDRAAALDDLEAAATRGSGEARALLDRLRPGR